MDDCLGAFLWGWGWRPKILAHVMILGYFICFCTFPFVGYRFVNSCLIVVLIFGYTFIVVPCLALANSGLLLGIG